MSAGAALWPPERLGEALHDLARRAGLGPREVRLEPPAGATAPDPWVDAAATWLGLETEAVHMPYREAAGALARSGPALFRALDDAGEVAGYLAVLGGGRGTVRLLGPAGAVHRAPTAEVRTQLFGPLVARHGPEIERLVAEAGVAPGRRPRAVEALLEERLGPFHLRVGWILRQPASASFLAQLRRWGVLRRVGLLAGAHTVRYVLFLAGWALVGRGALSGRFDRGWLLGWALLLLTLVPLRMAVTWLQGVAAIEAGALLKRRMFAGTLRLEPDENRHQGSGQMLGQVVESQAVETLALSGASLALVASVELVFTGTLLAIGAGGWPHLALFLAWVAVTAGLARWYTRCARAWTAHRLAMTHDLVERMVGHRTRLAQESPDHWHDDEDAALARYLEHSRRLDRASALLIAGVPRGWLLVGIAGLAPAFVSGSGSVVGLAIGVGAVILALRAFEGLGTGLGALAGARIAWEQVGPLFHAAGRPMVVSPPHTLFAAPDDDGAVVEAREMVFRYRDRGEPAIRGASLSVRPGDRLLLEGPSGGGKSTLASLLAGLRTPESGLLLVRGLDRPTLGEHGWRRRIAAAPQFHENHVLTETFAFNLLMGREWPASSADLAEADALCRELGLGPLLDRMPSGLFQMVGESGWQLSHGERSRLFIARALLQRAELIVLDESFAALDPENLRSALRCVLDRAPALVVIAHP